MLGRVFDRYQVEELVTEDPKASVYRVQHQTLKSPHLLKVLKGHADGGRLIERLRMQGQVQAKLRHDNVVPVTDILDVDGAPGLIMAWSDGPDLLEWMAGDPSPGARFDVFEHILKGLAAAHDAGLVHRDLRPETILINFDPDGRPVARIADFGLVKILGGKGIGTQNDALLPTGTACYTAPEVLSRPSEADQRADMFSLGCLLYFLATGRHAFESTNVVDLLTRVGAADYAPPGDDIPEPVRALIEELIVADPEARLPDCAVAGAFMRDPAALSRRYTLPPKRPQEHVDAPAAPAAIPPFVPYAIVAALMGLILMLVFLALP